MNQFIENIKAFHRRFEIPKYSEMERERDKQDMAEFRHRFLMEEMQEYLTSAHSGNDHDRLDAYVDMVYIILGSCDVEGWDFEEAWNRVHDANMSKVPAITNKNSDRNSKFDIVKPEGWKAPDLSDLV